MPAIPPKEVDRILGKGEGGQEAGKLDHQDAAVNFLDECLDKLDSDRVRCSIALPGNRQALQTYYMSMGRCLGAAEGMRIAEWIDVPTWRLFHGRALRLSLVVTTVHAHETQRQPKPLAGPAAVGGFLEECLDQVTVARARCNVLVPGQAAQTARLQQEAFRAYLMQVGRLLGVGEALFKAGWLEESAWKTYHQKTLNTLASTVVGAV